MTTFVETPTASMLTTSPISVENNINALNSQSLTQAGNIIPPTKLLTGKSKKMTLKEIEDYKCLWCGRKRGKSKSNDQYVGKEYCNPLHNSCRGKYNEALWGTCGYYWYLKVCPDKYNTPEAQEKLKVRCYKDNGKKIPETPLPKWVKSY
jgi:hypothetical protein